MNEEKKKILQMLSEGKIKAEEAALLLEQLESPRREDAPGRTDEKCCACASPPANRAGKRRCRWPSICR